MNPHLNLGSIIYELFDIRKSLHLFQLQFLHPYNEPTVFISVVD